MTLKQQRILLARIFVAVHAEAHVMGWDAVLDYARRCPECLVGQQNSAHKEARALDLVLYSRHTGTLCRDDAVFAALHDLADRLGAAPRIPGDLGHFSVTNAGQVR